MINTTRDKKKPCKEPEPVDNRLCDHVAHAILGNVRSHTRKRTHTDKIKFLLREKLLQPVNLMNPEEGRGGGGRERRGGQELQEMVCLGKRRRCQKPAEREVAGDM